MTWEHPSHLASRSELGGTSSTAGKREQMGSLLKVFVQFTEPLALGRRYIRDRRRKIQDDVFSYPEPKSPQRVFIDLLAQ